VNLHHPAKILTRSSTRTSRPVKKIVIAFSCIIYKKINDNEKKLSQRERNYSAVISANITGGLIAKQLGLIDWDMKAIYNYVAPKLLDIRVESDIGPAHPAEIVAEYVQENYRNMLVVDSGVDIRKHAHKLPIQEPSGPLLIRYEPDTKLLYLTVKDFKKSCVEKQVNYKDTLQVLRNHSILIESGIKRLSKGTKVVVPGVWSLVFDCGNSEFIDMGSIIAPEETGKAEANADRGDHVSD
jgi:hypothetical protein